MGILEGNITPNVWLVVATDCTFVRVGSQRSRRSFHEGSIWKVLHVLWIDQVCVEHLFHQSRDNIIKMSWYVHPIISQLPR